MRTSYLLPLLIIFVIGCGQNQSPSPDTPVQTASLESGRSSLSGPEMDEFGDYWYQGEAELTSYDLKQARYGEIHDGRAVLVFVTEPFSKSKHVKLDNPSEAGNDAANVLKLNLTRKFNTGIYPYSMMSSIFTPVKRQELPHTLKITTSVQEWCGHVFQQFNRTDDGYRTRQFSYFESEGDTEGTLPNVALEDEVWTTIRLNPTDLPTGTLQMVPGTQFLRLSHADTRPYEARATLETVSDSLRAYTVDYPELDRTLTIEFKADFPYEIEGWTETYPSGFGEDAKMLTTEATRQERTMQPYWQQNSTADESLRTKVLGLDM